MEIQDETENSTSESRKAKWLADKLTYLKALKAPNDMQRLLLALAEKPAAERTHDDNRKLDALIRAERATERAMRARADASRFIQKEKDAARKARDHALYQSAGLLILAGLVDGQTGIPLYDKATLLGSLIAIRSTLARPRGEDARHDDLMSAWRKAGTDRLAKNQPESSSSTNDTEETKA